MEYLKPSLIRKPFCSSEISRQFDESKINISDNKKLQLKSCKVVLIRVNTEEIKMQLQKKEHVNKRQRLKKIADKAKEKSHINNNFKEMMTADLGKETILTTKKLSTHFNESNTNISEPEKNCEKPEINCSYKASNNLKSKVKSCRVVLVRVNLEEIKNQLKKKKNIREKIEDETNNNFKEVMNPNVSIENEKKKVNKKFIDTTEENDKKIKILSDITIVPAFVKKK